MKTYKIQIVNLLRYFITSLLIIVFVTFLGLILTASFTLNYYFYIVSTMALGLFLIFSSKKYYTSNLEISFIEGNCISLNFLKKSVVKTINISDIEKIRYNYFNKQYRVCKIHLKNDSPISFRTYESHQLDMDDFLLAMEKKKVKVYW